MLFSSLTFLYAFLPIVLVLYFITKNRMIRNIILLVFSLIFYAWGEPKYILLMIFSIVFNYLSALLFEKLNKQKKIIFIINIIINIGLLFIFKYLNFGINIFNSILGLEIPLKNIVLPIGISFYTFQIMSYVIDAYLGKVKIQKNIINLATYVTLFPQLIAGPIVRYETIENELENRTETFDNVINGFKRFIVGLSKKVLIANQMAYVCDSIYLNVSDAGTILLWVAAIAYAFQIYFDFSGYSDMAIGLGKMFGFNFLENFNYPYISKSVTEFWRRWHISLSTWFKDYVYIPLGGNRVGKYRHIINILIVWLLTGLWHGASWNYVLWGLYYGILLIIDKRIISKLKINTIIKWICTMFIVIIGWTIFRLENASELLLCLRKMFIFDIGNNSKIILDNFNLLYCMLYFIPAAICSTPLIEKILEKFKKYSWFELFINFVLVGLFFGCIIFLVSSNYNPFIYFRF